MTPNRLLPLELPFTPSRPFLKKIQFDFVVEKKCLDKRKTIRLLLTQLPSLKLKLIFLCLV